jgi:hypothetical protein
VDVMDRRHDGRQPRADMAHLDAALRQLADSLMPTPGEPAGVGAVQAAARANIWPLGGQGGCMAAHITPPRPCPATPPPRGARRPAGRLPLGVGAAAGALPGGARAPVWLGGQRAQRAPQQRHRCVPGAGGGGRPGGWACRGAGAPAGAACPAEGRVAVPLVPPKQPRTPPSQALCRRPARRRWRWAWGS